MTITSAPSAAGLSAVASPIPEVPPMITTRRCASPSPTASPTDAGRGTGPPTRYAWCWWDQSPHQPQSLTARKRPLPPRFRRWEGSRCCGA
jgi:hypothetical protein